MSSARVHSRRAAASEGSLMYQKGEWPAPGPPQGGCHRACVPPLALHSASIAVRDSASGNLKSR